MTDLTAICPKCGKKCTNYFHFVDEFGMGKEIPNGKYSMECTAYYRGQQEKDFCGHVFKVKVTNEQRIKVVK